MTRQKNRAYRQEESCSTSGCPLCDMGQHVGRLISRRPWLMLGLGALILAAVAYSATADSQPRNDLEEIKQSKEEQVKKHVVATLTRANFDETLKSEDIVLVDFWAPWCGPCRMQSPILDEVSQKLGENLPQEPRNDIDKESEEPIIRDNVNKLSNSKAPEVRPPVIGKLNIDQDGDIAQRYNVRSIPTLLLFKNGEIVQRFVGVQKHNTLLSAIEDAMQEPEKVAERDNRSSSSRK